MNHVKDVMLEPNPKTVYGGSIPKMEGLSECKDRDVTRTVQAN